MLTALGSLATQQANPTETTLAQIHQFLDYALSHPNAVVTYRASDMVLAAHSDVSYLSKTNAGSRVGGQFFLSQNDHYLNNNGAVLTIAQIIKSVMSWYEPRIPPGKPASDIPKEGYKDLNV